MAADAKPKELLIHVSPHYLGSAKVFQTSPQKAEFGGRTAWHTPLEWHKGCPHTGAYVACVTKFFKNIQYVSITIMW
jgi:hypothetical protein